MFTLNRLWCNDHAMIYLICNVSEPMILHLQKASFLMTRLISFQPSIYIYMSRVMRKPTFDICENKDADQLRGNREADQPLCFRYIDSIIPLLSKSEISCL